MNDREGLRLFHGHNVLAVLQAHRHSRRHSYERIELNGISFITTRAVAGADWRGSLLGTREGYTEITVAGCNVESRYRTYGFTPDLIGAVGTNGRILATMGAARNLALWPS